MCFSFAISAFLLLLDNHNWIWGCSFSTPSPTTALNVSVVSGLKGDLVTRVLLDPSIIRLMNRTIVRK